MSSKTSSVAAALVLSLGGCSFATDIGGCTNFHPQSAPVELGESVDVYLEASATRYRSLDVAGHYWEAQTTPSADLDLPRDRFVGLGDGVATLTEAEWVTGTLESGVVVVESAALGRLVFTGPLTCE